MYTSKVILSLPDRYKIFTSDLLWIGICQNAVLTKYHYDNNKQKTQKQKTKTQKKKPTFARSRPATENPTKGS